MRRLSNECKVRTVSQSNAFLSIKANEKEQRNIYIYIYVYSETSVTNMLPNLVNTYGVSKIRTLSITSNGAR